MWVKLKSIILMSILLYFWVNLMIFAIIKCSNEMGSTQPRHIGKATMDSLKILLFGLPLILYSLLRNRKDGI